MGANRSVGERTESGRVADCGAGLVASVGPLVIRLPLISDVTESAFALALWLAVGPAWWRILGLW